MFIAGSVGRSKVGSTKINRKKPAKHVGRTVKLLPKKPGIKLHYGRENRAEDARGREVLCSGWKVTMPGFRRVVASWN